MTTLLDLQRRFASALLARDDTSVLPLIDAAGMRAAARIDVYRNNIVSSLTDVLAETFPALRRLVDPRFFEYAAHEFLTASPPERPRLAEYGARFPAFIAGFEPCRPYPYFADVAQLEWLVHAAGEAPDVPAVGSTALQAVAPGDTPRLVLLFHPSFGYVESAWPIDRIWVANRAGGTSDSESTIQSVTLDAGGVGLEIARTRRGVALRELEASTFAFRNALWTGAALETAAEAALTMDPEYDLAAALGGLFSDEAILGLRLASPTMPGDQP